MSSPAPGDPEGRGHRSVRGCGRALSCTSAPRPSSDRLCSQVPLSSSPTPVPRSPHVASNTAGSLRNAYSFLAFTTFRMSPPPIQTFASKHVVCPHGIVHLSVCAAAPYVSSPCVRTGTAAFHCALTRYEPAPVTSCLCATGRGTCRGRASTRRRPRLLPLVFADSVRINAYGPAQG
ncbi:hypothetical protein C8Q77DRAFT_263650 [Trametes polyzona]|nr:hypothetical protein C8Q77DRAFT_263650 [Trametes polyzona]